MVHEDNLSSVLSEFARTMLTDFRIQGILDHLVERIVDVLDVTAAGVTLISAGLPPRYVAASDEAALRFEQLQTSLGQGPCLTAYASGEIVAIPDLARDDRYPQFGPAAVEAGLAAVFTFPLRRGESRLGALDLYRDTVGDLDPNDLVAAQTLADVAAAYLMNAQARQLVQEAAERFRDSSLHDALTGLPNRVLLQERLEHAADRAGRSRSTAAVLFVDLDRFKRVNDVYGHYVGDGLLIAVAERFSALVRPGDTLARVSGDEFVILCEDILQTLDVELLAVRIVDGFIVPFFVQGQEISITASVGVAFCGPGDQLTPNLLIDADTAMYQAKRRGGGIHRLIDVDAARDARQRDDLEQDLRTALDHEDLSVAYQPIVRAADGLVVGVEALLRWTHTGRGPIPALTTVGIAEQYGMIDLVGGWVLNRSCKDRIQWLADHPDRPLDLSVNVSARQVMRPGFAETVTSVLDSTGMDPASLMLEVTEGIFIDDGERAMRVLSDLKSLGVRLALDDFGTGYSSMNYLRRFPVDVVKIDQGFVADLTTDPAAAAIVSSINSLAHVLHMTVTAEGVETERQRDVVVGLGCELAQGFLYARPMSGTVLSTYLGSNPGRPLHLPQSQPLLLS